MKIILLLSFLLSACAHHPKGEKPQILPEEAAAAAPVNAEQVKKAEALRAEGLNFLFSKDPAVKDLKKAYAKFSEAAALGDPVSMDQLGGFHASGMGGAEKSCPKAMEWFDKAAQAGYPVAINNLAYMLVSCEDKKLRDPDRAEEMVKFLLSMNPVFLALLDTYAAVQAEQGNFNGAVKTMDVVIDTADLMGINPERIDEMKATQKLFAKKKRLDKGSQAQPESFRAEP